MLRAEITPALELRTVELLARPTSLAVTAERTGLTFRQVQEVATRHGYPDVRALEAAVPALRETAQQAAAEAAQEAAGEAVDEAHPEQRHDAAAALRDRQMIRVPVTALFPDPENPRVDVGDVTDLAASIRETGLIHPIAARRRGNTLIVVAGHRRLAALQLLGEKETDVVVSRDMRADDVLAAMLIENGHRRDLDPIEEARALAKLKAQRGWTSTELGKRIGRSQSFIDGRLALLALGAEQQSLVREGQMGVTHATQAGRARLGTVRNHATYRFHLGAEHPLAGKVRARCLRVHGKAAGRVVGHTGCGECWETVIRADEQRTSLERAIASGEPCPTCEQQVDPDLLVDDTTVDAS